MDDEDSRELDSGTKGMRKMTQNMHAIIMGGILPALFFGIAGVFAKPSTQAGIGTGPYLVCVGLAVALVGLVFHLSIPDKTISIRSGGFAVLVGLTWGFAAGLVAFTLSKYATPISKLVPLYNMNTLVAVCIGLVVFAEWKDVHISKLIIGSVLVVIGGTLVANA